MLVCTECRSVDMPPCEHISTDAIFYAGPKWRAPRKNNDLAWRRVAAGDILWDHKAIASNVDRARLAAEAKALGRWSQRCYYGHLIEHPNVVYSHYRNIKWPDCASCKRSRFDHAQALRQNKPLKKTITELADWYYKQTGLK